MPRFSKSKSQWGRGGEIAKDNVILAQRNIEDSKYGSWMICAKPTRWRRAVPQKIVGGEENHNDAGNPLDKEGSRLVVNRRNHRNLRINDKPGRDVINLDKLHGEKIENISHGINYGRNGILNQITKMGSEHLGSNFGGGSPLRTNDYGSCFRILGIEGVAEQGVNMQNTVHVE